MAILFTEGNNEYIDCGSDASLDDITVITISAWIFLNGWGQGKEGRIYDKEAIRLFSDENDASLTFEMAFPGQDGRWRTPTDSLSLSTWHHVAITYDRSSDANDPVMYIDGVSQTVTEERTPTGTASSDAGSAALIGNNAPSTQFDFDGILEDVRIYDRALSAPEIATICAARGADNIVDGLVLRHMLMEDFPGQAASGAGQQKDLSVEGNDGTPTASPSYDYGVIRSRRKVAG